MAEQKRKQMSAVVAIKRYLERDDNISPGGGRKVQTAELMALSQDERQELGALAAQALDVDLKPVGSK